jgi:hypothetical protein
MLTRRTNPVCDYLAGVIRQSVFAGIVVWGVALAVTHPPFGMGGPNYALAATFALAAAGMGALVARARAFLHIQRIWPGGTARLLVTGWGSCSAGT